MIINYTPKNYLFQLEIVDIFLLKYKFRGDIMFTKKQMIHSETLGICRVDDIVKLANKAGDITQYYMLRSVAEGKVAYIPVENHEVKLRELTEEEKSGL